MPAPQRALFFRSGREEVSQRGVQVSIVKKFKGPKVQRGKRLFGEFVPEAREPLDWLVRNDHYDYNDYLEVIS